MNVGDTLAWELPDEPDWGTIVEPVGKAFGELRFERNAYVHADAGGWTSFTDPNTSGRSVTRWAFILYYAKGKVRLTSDPETVLSWSLPAEPPLGSVVRMSNGTEYEKRHDRLIPGGVWCVVGSESSYPRDWPFALILEWSFLLYRSGGSVEIVRIGEES